MSRKREYMKYLISLSFKDLMQEYPFDKITIKMITNRAGIIRSTFYHHFKDKQDLLEWIIREELLKPAEEHLERNDLRSAITTMVHQFLRDRDFYHKAVHIGGQNGFWDIIHQAISEFGEKLIESRLEAQEWRSPLLDIKKSALLNTKLVTEYFTNNFVFTITQLLSHEDIGRYSAEEITEAYLELSSCSLAAFFREPEKV